MLKLFDVREDRPDFSTRYPLEEAGEDLRNTVRSMLGSIREEGWDKVLEFSREFDGVAPEEPPVEPSTLESAWNDLNADEREALEVAAGRIRRYQRSIKPSSTLITDGNTGSLGEVLRPLETVGCYVPGGRFPLPSTVLMTAFVAEVAGVEEIVVCTPPTGDDELPHKSILAACSLLDDPALFPLGGVQAVGAMAYGTGPVPEVDLLAGPGNLYVTLAKKEVFGRVDIDMLAGPSEICVIAEESKSRADWIAADLLSQAEHDPKSRVFALSPQESFLESIRETVREHLEEHPNPGPVREALDNSALLVTRNVDEAVEISNELAPEHLELHVESPNVVAGQCRNAGAIFCGKYTPEPLGDYTAGPSHTLPTGGTARFFSPLSVRTFMKSQSLISFDRGGYRNLKGPTETLAGMESLHSHSRSITVRSETETPED